MDGTVWVEGGVPKGRKATERARAWERGGLDEPMFSAPCAPLGSPGTWLLGRRVRKQLPPVL